ncbi:MAG: radical SAM protein [Clostridiales bacterium]|jgi:hypothetical protein|nr:radical SAM protein [Clostridiales bacterium]
MKRYALDGNKFPREIVLLKSTGCHWSRCTFCDYHADKAENDQEAASFNRKILQRVTGAAGALMVIDSAAFSELPQETISDIFSVCKTKKIKTVILEQHWNFRGAFPELRKLFAEIGTECKFLIGLESFDFEFREKVLNKGMTDDPSPQEISAHFEWCNLLAGIKGQTLEMIARDIRQGLEVFQRIAVNVFIPNSTPAERDGELTDAFYKCDLFREIANNPRVDILDALDARAPDRLGGIGNEDNGIEEAVC